MGKLFLAGSDSGQETFSMGLDAEDLKEIIDDFIIEAAEALEQIDQDLVALEEDVENSELTNRIFRHLHTIKGTANFLNAEAIFAEMAQVAHAAEDVMGGIREGKITLRPEMMDAVLEAVDAIKKLFADVQSEHRETRNYQPLAKKLRSFLQHQVAAPPAPESPEPEPAPPQKTVVDSPKPVRFQTKALAQAIPPGTLSDSLSEQDRLEIIDDFLQESQELLEKIDQGLVKLEKEPEDEKLLKEIYRCVHTLKGTTSFLGFNEISRLTHAAEEVIKLVHQGTANLSPQVMDAVLAVVDILKNFFARLQKGDSQQGEHQTLIDKLERLAARPQKGTGDSDSTRLRQSISAATVPAVTKKIASASEQTIRVETTRLDKLMNLVGELVLGRNRLLQTMRNLEERLGDDRACHELMAAVDFIDFVTSDLQMAVLKTRMQPIGKIFNRFTRTVRDLARELGKDIRLIINGADTELDKSVIDELGDPLIHLLRNAVDHGIELPSERKGKNKPAIGTVSLSAFHEGNRILIELRDDGKGIDPQIVKEKAVSQGLIGMNEAERLPSKEIMEFIFAPGFSTASKVTNVSGRGVGMDVVKNSIEKLNGTIDVWSSIGQGSTFIISLPLTLAIIQALLVKVGKEIFAMPLGSVIETLRIYPHQIEMVSGREVIRFRNSIVPLVRLKKLFELADARESHLDRIYIVVAGTAEKKIGLVVDRIVGQEEVVVKSLGKLLQNTPGISGACIGGDGKVTLIIDLAGIFRMLPHSVSTLISQVRDDKLTPSRHLKGSSPCILVVEDSRSERKRTRLTIESKGYKVVEAGDGKEALSKMHDYQIDMVITDIEMPELDGYELAAKIREHKKFSSLPIIAISSHKEMIDRIKGMEAGIDTYLPKPFNEQDLFNSMKNLLP